MLDLIYTKKITMEWSSFNEEDYFPYQYTILADWYKTQIDLGLGSSDEPFLPAKNTPSHMFILAVNQTQADEAIAFITKFCVDYGKNNPKLESVSIIDISIPHHKSGEPGFDEWSISDWMGL